MYSEFRHVFLVKAIFYTFSHCKKLYLGSVHLKCLEQIRDNVIKVAVFCFVILLCACVKRLCCVVFLPLHTQTKLVIVLSNLNFKECLKFCKQDVQLKLSSED